MAEQDKPVRRTVALKVIKPGMDTAQVIARFEAERQALALMDHPNIAKVLDAGTTAEGRPFFVMELVKGVPITRYCDDAKLTPRERLELFVPVCQAVQHAHQKGIIHRDLKPSNVLIAQYDSRPVPKVIDFGVAKATGGKLTDRTMFTDFGAVVGTFEYMAPEQASFNQMDVDTRADVYALGVILYELLTGATPFDRKRLRQAAFDELLRIIREEEPPKPSTRLSASAELPSVAAVRRTEPAKLSRMVRGDLDWIVMKALEKDRGRRYETANGFARDVQRYLADEAVEASPPSATYRLRKFVRRNRGPVVAGGALVLALLGGIAGTTWQAYRARVAEGDAKHQAWVAGEERDAKEIERAKVAVERDRALAARHRTREALDAMVSGVAGDSLTTQVALSAEQRTFLNSVVKYYEQFAAEPGEDREGRERLAKAHWKLGLIRMRLGLREEAVPAYRRSVELYEQLTADFPDAPAYRRELATSHGNLGLLLKDLGQMPEAEAAYRAAIALEEASIADHRANAFNLRNWSLHHNNLAKLLTDMEKHSEAEASCRAGLDIAEKLVATYPGVPDYQMVLAHLHNTFGFVFNNRGQWPEAEAKVRQALAIHEKLATDHAGVPKYRSAALICRNNLGALLRYRKMYPAAAAEFRVALPLQEKLAADYPGVPEYRDKLAISHRNLGHLLRDMGQRPQAEAAFRAALAIREKLTTDFPAVPEYRKELASTHGSMGELFGQLGRGPEAETEFRAALATFEKLAADHPVVPEYRNLLGDIQYQRAVMLNKLNERPEALVALRASVEIRRKLVAEFPTLPEYRHNLARSEGYLGSVFHELGKTAEAEALYRAAVAVHAKMAAEYPANSSYKEHLAKSSGNHGIMLRRLGKPAEAIAAYRVAMPALEALISEFPTVPEHRFALAANRQNLGVLLRDLGQLPEAETEYREVLSLFDKVAADAANLPGYGQFLELTLVRFADILVRRGNPGEAVMMAGRVAVGKAPRAAMLYDCARIVARAAAVEGNPDGDAHAARAVELLRQAVAKGFNNIPQLLKEADLAALHGRADYANLLWELADRLQP